MKAKSYYYYYGTIEQFIKLRKPRYESRAIDRGPSSGTANVWACRGYQGISRIFALVFWQRHFIRTGNEIEARVDLNYLMIRQHFITHNHYVENKSIEVRLVEGPFTYLEGKWQFTATSEDSCLIHFELHYEFSNFLISKAFGPVFKVISNTMVEAFIKEADKRYG